MNIVSDTTLDGVRTIVYENGDTITQLLPDPNATQPEPPTPQPSEVEVLKNKLEQLQNTMDLILLKQEGLI